MNITPSSRNNQHLILFNVAPYTFCAPAAEVESIIMLPPVSRLPLAPPSVIGLINHRGQVYRVISLRRKLGLETGPPLMEGQLILTHLPAGLTAFLVDDVVDVLPDTNLARHPLSAHSAMDLFDAFILRDEQVLFHTTFDTIDQARETDYPNPDLKTLERVAADKRIPAATIESTVIDESEANVTGTPEKKIGRNTPRPEMSASKAPLTQPATRPARSRAGVAAVPASHNNRPLTPPDPDRRKPVPPQRKRSSNARTHRYALALTGILLLLLIVTLSSGLLLKQSMVVSQPPQTGAPIAPPPAIAMTKERPAPSQETRRAPSQTKDAPEQAQQPSASTTPLTALPDTTVTTPPSEVAISPEVTPLEEPSPSPPTIANEDAVIATEEPSQSSREILRMETETFTLMVERPSANPQTPSAPLSDLAPLISTTIVHRVVPGDTLWDIAGHYMGDPFQYPELARLSQIHNPDLIFPGDVIRIIKKGR